MEAPFWRRRGSRNVEREREREKEGERYIFSRPEYEVDGDRRKPDKRDGRRRVSLQSVFWFCIVNTNPLQERKKIPEATTTTDNQLPVWYSSSPSSSHPLTEQKGLAERFFVWIYKWQKKGNDGSLATCSDFFVLSLGSLNTEGR